MQLKRAFSSAGADDFRDAENPSNGAAGQGRASVVGGSRDGNLKLDIRTFRLLVPPKDDGVK